MAITNTEISKVSLGNRKMIIGKSVISGGTDTGDVEVALGVIENFTPVISNTDDLKISVDETFPLKDTAVTITTEGNDRTVYWTAIGY